MLANGSDSVVSSKNTTAIQWIIATRFQISPSIIWGFALKLCSYLRLLIKILTLGTIKVDNSQDSWSLILNIKKPKPVSLSHEKGLTAKDKDRPWLTEKIWLHCLLSDQQRCKRELCTRRAMQSGLTVAFLSNRKLSSWIPGLINFKFNFKPKKSDRWSEVPDKKWGQIDQVTPEKKKKNIRVEYHVELTPRRFVNAFCSRGRYLQWFLLRRRYLLQMAVEVTSEVVPVPDQSYFSRSSEPCGRSNGDIKFIFLNQHRDKITRKTSLSVNAFGFVIIRIFVNKTLKNIVPE